MKVNQKNVYITGGNRGIGLALAKELHSQGAIIHICCRNPDESIKDNFVSDKERVFLKKLDLSSRENIDEFINAAKSGKWEIDILFNNAGLLTGGLLEEQNTQDIYQMFQVNIVGLVHLTKGLLPLLLQRPEAKIINNSSVSGIMFLPCASTYAAAKAGVVALTRSLDVELKNTNVSTLVLITPGIKTRMYDEIENKYGKNVDLSLMSYISPEKYAKIVYKCILKNKKEYWPSGSAKLVLLLSVYCLWLFKIIAGSQFKRSPN